MHTTCPLPSCNYKFADLHETGTHVIVYCQNCGYTKEHKRRNPVKLDIAPATLAGAKKTQKRKGRVMLKAS